MKRNNKGITLIALVITIIVMLILVGVTINMAVHGGLFGYAGNATKKTKEAMKDEKEFFAVEEEQTTYDLIEKFSTTKYGDCNEDGKVSNKDVTRLYSWLQGTATLTEQGKINADVNLDGIIDETDMNIISNHLKNGIPSKLPYVQ